MLLALGSLQLDLTGRAVIIGVVEAGDDPVERALEVAGAGADALWLRAPAPAGAAGSAALTTGVVAAVAGAVACPVGVDAPDAAAVDALADVGAAAVGLRTDQTDAISAAAHRSRTVLLRAGDRSGPDAAARAASEAGLAPARVLVDSPAPLDGAHPCCTLPGRGPASWGRLTVLMAGGVRVVRTTDVRSARRVATVVDRLVAARSTLEAEPAR